MMNRRGIISALLCCVLALSSHGQKKDEILAVHLINYTDDEKLEDLAQKVPDLAAEGINTIFLEVSYHFNFTSHPELKSPSGVISKNGAKNFSELCKKNGIEVIPQFQCLGHQSWEKNTFSLLTEYPELDLTPGAFSNNEGIYCREWDVTNPKVNEIVFPMIHEIVEAFNSKALHIGMDEVFLLGHEKSPNTKGKNPAELFAKTVNELHEEFAQKKGLQLFMWGDRLIDASKYGYGKWEASANGTYPAVDLIPKDIVICDWHYNQQRKYPSVDMFLNKGFKVLPSSWKNPKAVDALIRYSYAMDHPNMLGHLFTTWSVNTDDLVAYPPMLSGLNVIQNKMFHEVFFKIVEDKKGAPSLALSTKDEALEIKYSTKDPRLTKNQKYTDPIPFDQSIDIYAQAFRDGEAAGQISTAYFINHKAYGKKVEVLSEMSEDYATEKREGTLTDGVYETEGFANGDWLGFEKEDFIATIDLEQKTALKSISMNFYNEVNAWVHHPKKVEIFGSMDGKNFESIAIWKQKMPIGKPVVNIALNLEGKYRYLKVHAHNKTIPEGFNGEGNKAWIFVDEVVVK